VLSRLLLEERDVLSFCVCVFFFLKRGELLAGECLPLRLSFSQSLKVTLSLSLVFFLSLKSGFSLLYFDSRILVFG
jgi:hypothetical protein